METGCVKATKRPCMRDKMEKLNALLVEALSIEDRICGPGPASEQNKNPSDAILNLLDCSIESAMDKASRIVSRLQQIEEQLN